MPSFSKPPIAKPPVFRFYTRAGCSLCRHAQQLLESWELPLEVIDIAGDPALVAEHGHFVPVLALEWEGQEQIWHRGPMTRENLPILKMRCLRLQRGQQHGSKQSAVLHPRFDDGRDAMLRA